MAEVDLSQLAVDRSESPQPFRHRSNLLTRYVLPGLLIIGFVGLVGWASRDYAFPPKPVQVIPVLATQAEVRTEGSALFNAAGWIEPRPTAIRVAALAPGVVEELLVVEDQLVKSGQPIAELIKDDAKLAHERAIANRQLAEAELERSQAAFAAAKTRFEQPVHLEAMLAKAEADLANIKTMLTNLPFETIRAESQLKFAQRDHDRYFNAQDSVSDREVEQALTELETAKASWQELRDRDASLRGEVTAATQRRNALNVQLQLLADETKAKDESLAMVKAAEAQVKQMEVAEAEALLRLTRMTIRAPVDGRVYQLVGLPGARVGAGVMTAMQGHDGSSIITMYRPESLQVRVDVRFEDIPKVSLGQPIRIDNPALDEPIEGSVLFISSEADIQKNTLQVKVAIDSPPDFFKPEMLVDVTFLAPRQQGAVAQSEQELRLYIPQKLVGQFEGTASVWIADQARGKARRVAVETGAAGAGGLIEITSGLDVGSRIITVGVEGLTENHRIRVTGEDNIN